MGCCRRPAPAGRGPTGSSARCIGYSRAASSSGLARLGPGPPRATATVARRASSGSPSGWSRRRARAWPPGPGRWIPHDRIDILQFLEALERVGVMQPHALPHDLQDIHDAERVVALVGAEARGDPRDRPPQRVHAALWRRPARCAAAHADRPATRESSCSSDRPRAGRGQQFEPGHRAQNFFRRPRPRRRCPDGDGAPRASQRARAGRPRPGRDGRAGTA